MSAAVSEPREDDRAPSFEAASEAHQQVLFTHDALRLYWTLNGPLTSAISVMDDKFYDPDVPLEPYCLQTEPPLSWSSVAQSPLTEPKISSVTVTVGQLYEWEDQWMEVHHDHAIPGVHNYENDWILFGPLAEFDPDSDSEGPEHLLRCCDGDRPRKTKVSLVVNAAEGFLTVHDYVSAVHPWLMGLREKILQASGDLETNVPLPSDTRLMINLHYSSPDFLDIAEEERWKQERSKKEHLKFTEQVEAWKRQRAQEDQELWELELWKQEQGW